MDTSITKSKYTLLLIGLALLILLIAATGIWFFVTKAKTPAVPEAVTTTATPSPEKRPPASSKPLPQVTFRSWTSQTSLSANARSSFQWKLVQPSSQLAQSIGSKLGVTQFASDQKFVKSVSTQETDTSLFFYEIENGSFLYISQTGIPVQAAETEEVTGKTVLDFLKSIGFYDSQMSFAISYERTSKPGITYYEIHHDWGKTGLPILSELGTVSFPENTKLSSLRAGQPSELEDKDIIKTSDSSDGKARAVDFNSVTVGVKDNAVVYIKSKMRLLDSQSGINVISAAEALDKAKSGEYKSLISMPSGEGSIDWEKVYPGNTGIGDAVITDSLLSYIEDPMRRNQEELTPFWILRGTSQLDSGFRTKFIVTVPANLNDGTQPTPQAMNKGSYSLISGVYASENTLAQIQQRGFDRKETPAPDNPAQAQTTVTPQQNSDSNRPSPFLSPRRTVTPGRRVTSGPLPSRTPYVSHGAGAIECSQPMSQDWIDSRQIYTFDGYDFVEDYGFWYMVVRPDTEITIDTAEVLYNNFYNPLATAFDPDFLRGLYADNIVEFFDEAKRYAREYGNGTCYFRVTGNSPTLFYYGNDTIVVKPGLTTYSDPALENSVWSVSPYKNKLLVNGVETDSMYYEYKTDYNYSPPPNKGWLIEKKDLLQFSKKIALRLELTKTETDTLYFELMQLYKNQDRLLLSLIPQATVEQIAPLAISTTDPARAAPHVERIMFSATLPRKGMEITEPDVPKIARPSSMVLEIGGFTKQ